MTTASMRLRWMGLAGIAVAVGTLGSVPACSSSGACRDGTLLVTVELGAVAASASDLQVIVSLDAINQAPLIFAPQGRALRASESIEIGLPARSPHPTVAVTVVARSAAGLELARASTPPPGTKLTGSCLSLTVSFPASDAGVPDGAMGVGGGGGTTGVGGAGGAPGVGGGSGVGGSDGGVPDGGGGVVGTGGTAGSATGGTGPGGRGGAVAASGGASGGRGGTGGTASGGVVGSGGATGGRGGSGTPGGKGGASSSGGAGGASTPRCGDAIINGQETCDDGFTSNGDGCSGTCQIEPNWTCKGTPSVCTVKPMCVQTSYSGGNYDRASATTSVVLAVSAVSQQDIFAGAASDGGSILVLRGCQSNGGVWLFDGSLSTGAYTGTNVAAGLTGLNLGEGRFTLAPDGLTVVAALPTGYGVAVRRRASRTTTVFGAADTSEFVNVNDWAASKSAAIIGPTLSPDGLSLTFIVATPVTGETDSHYEVTRPQVGAPFNRPGAAMAGALVGLGSVTGISADRLTIFVFNAFTTETFVRAGLTAPFVRQTTRAISGFRVMPLDAGCHKLIGTGTPGGCAGEEVFVISE